MMKRILLLLIFMYSGGLLAEAQTGLKAFMPRKSEMQGWAVAGQFKEYRGDNLIFAANRDADLFYEYGFVGVLRGDFVDAASEKISLEIFRMSDVYASYAIYLHKTRGMRNSYQAGKEAFWDGNSLVLWKHHFVAVITGDAGEQSVKMGMEELASVIDSRIKIQGRKPTISQTFADSPGRVTLLRGKFSLQNIYYFTSKDVFRIEQGYAIEKQGLTDIHLIYNDSFTSIRRFGEVAGVLSREKKFAGFTMVGPQAFRMYDSEGNDISIESEKNLLNIRIQKVITATPAGVN
ncbi:MAG: DUF6599 family protein [Marinilabiliaceae bacterium]|jgi:hypothetical protein|nr:DUF6599 family protein [Marinilabiliaceae bacterium]